jgi:ABC-type phosphate transport system substrate-binding protein
VRITITGSEIRIMSRALPTLIALLGLVNAVPAVADDFAVIVNRANTSAVDSAVVARVYLGDKKLWDDGTPVMAIDLPENNAARGSFSAEVLNKTVTNMKAFWAQMVFSGKALPPKVASNDDDVKRIVSANKGAIGYVKASSVDDSVKVAVK